ncbi:hypothetical protein ABFS82_07G099000 [Erythranthe guttata]|uniref:probable LRR receptor-like serine/threonine-protein kinase At3g47570 n=1 Tax=Erythranthe guttata TaxID=4155 RepID=UPI00064DA034|nr:PREDICTED: probable LRR receptor-like serine/threonine-protein kinase At3g47570 [Erythranthe guttata]|eukprot:XP_012832989.1 PREDICTED: probable LRR receptor-like serine/threonine-protein kinase At3g47570 [Erythranthe guttata]
MTNSIIILSLFIFSSLALLTNQTDVLSLLAFKEAIDVDPNGALNSWNRTTNFCRWNGITCGRKHPNRVVAINLDSQGLIGSLSPHIGNLSFLRTISLQNNGFSGRIPQEIGQLQRLESILFSNNSFNGIIPRNISQCRNLVYLYLIDNNLSGNIPSELGLLYKLELLSLTRNTLLGPIPQSIGNLTSLQRLSLRSCGLIGEIPESFSRLRRLIFIQIGENNLTGPIPTSLFNISTIEFLGVSFNGFRGSIPSTIGLTLPNLQLLYMGSNRLSGRFPVSISNASSLQELVFPINYFSGPLPSFEGLSQLQLLYAADNNIEDNVSSIISSLTNCTNLRGLDLSINPLRGSLPETIGNLSINLDHIGLASTGIYGKIPNGIGNLVKLTYLYFYDNNLEGPLPLSIGKLSILGILFLSENRFSGEIPSIFGNLSLLTNLYMQGNNFSGAIPKSIGNNSNLLELHMSRNNLSGFIPQELMNLSSISISLDLSYNAFTGSIPVEVGSLRNLASLDLSNNRLSGLIPNSLGTCISLGQLYLQGNLFEGQIPRGLSSLTGLVDLDLSRNNLSGTIPSFFGTLRLQQLNLSFNMLQGQVPTTGVFENKTANSLQGNKDLCGGVLELGLSPCTSSSVSSKKKNLSTPLKIAIPLIVGVATIMSLVVFLHWRRTSNKSPPSPELLAGIPFLRLSYSDLLKATGGFAETSLVGVGSFGSVYKGILDDGMKTIAVKVLNLVVRGASKSFMAECNALRDIRHRNLVKILSVCESIDFQGNDFKAIVYEFKANWSLDKWLYYNGEQEQESDPQLRNLDLIERLNIAIDIAMALEYLHCGTESTIVHGDLKPSNILLDEDMMACVGDFGLAKIISSVHPPHESSSTIGIKGTIGYVPPEYGTSNTVSEKGDVYSYGILVLEMFTNKRPTDDSFMDGVNLRNFVEAALPDCVMEIVDPLIRIGPRQNNSKFEDCMCSIMSIGLSCSMEMPRERKPMTDVVNELHKIQKELCG